MSTYYVILFASASPLSGEKMSIGLILSDGTRTIYDWSRPKLNLLLKLFSTEAKEMLKGQVKALEKMLHNPSSASMGYLDYLSRYRNNAISFSPPVAIDVPVSMDAHERLFQKYIFTAPAHNKRQIGKSVTYNDSRNLQELAVHEPLERYGRFKDYRDEAKHILQNAIAPFVNFEQRLTNLEVPSLLVPDVTVSFIGRNNFPVVGDVVDFEAKENVLSTQLASFISLKTSFELGGEKKGKYYLIGQEPDKKLYRQHQSWAQLRRWKQINLVPLEDIDKIRRYMVSHSIRPFIS